MFCFKLILVFLGWLPNGDSHILNKSWIDNANINDSELWCSSLFDLGCLHAENLKNICKQYEINGEVLNNFTPGIVCLQNLELGFRLGKIETPKNGITSI